MSRPPAAGDHRTAAHDTRTGRASPRRQMQLALVVVAAAAAAWLLAPARRGRDAAPDDGAVPGQVPERLVVEVLNRRPHDTSAFTQGLLLHEGRMYESTGHYGQSTLREVDPLSGTVVRQVAVPSEIFAEGLALVEDELFQLSWKRQVARIYDLDTFDVIGEFDYDGEGWGLCFDGSRLVMSNGSGSLYFRDPETFELLDQVPVTVDGELAGNLNELECVEGDVYANVWLTDTILRIDAGSGVATGIVDAAGLLTPEEDGPADVLNGIAWDPERETFLVTGKWWPWLFEVRFVPEGGGGS